MARAWEATRSNGSGRNTMKEPGIGRDGNINSRPINISSPITADP